MMTREQLAQCIDHTILKPEANEEQVRATVAEAVAYRFGAVCVNPRWVKLVGELLEASRAGARPITDAPIALCACVGFPFGTAMAETKAFEARGCVQDGAQEIDMVIFLPAVLAQDLAVARADVQAVVQAARAIQPATVVKVILETALLNEDQVILGCRAAREGGADFVKTSTGFHPAGGASVAAVRLLKAHAGGMKVKASGGIRDAATAQAMLAAGADRLGCSASAAIMDAWGEASKDRLHHGPAQP